MLAREVPAAGARTGAGAALESAAAGPAISVAMRGAEEAVANEAGALSSSGARSAAAA